MAQITQKVQQCPECAKAAGVRKEPLMSSPLPDYPWQIIATDLFEIKGDKYLLIVDYFSRFPEVVKLTSTTSATVISILKSIFSRFGIPEVVRSDNGPQYSSQEFASFAASHGFKHITSSPLYPQSNGQAERAVQTVKQLLKKESANPHLALLSYRATPLPWYGLSPAELLMGRRVRTPVPQTDRHLTPQWPYLQEFREKDHKFKECQSRDFNKRHQVRKQPAVPQDTEVWVSSGAEPVPGRVIAQSDLPRSYVVDTPSGQVRRNRRHLTMMPTPATAPTESETSTPSEQTTAEPSRRVTRSQTGTPINPPERLA